MNETEARFTVLADRGVVAVAGADAAGFLDNLVTNDLQGMEDGSGRLAALLSPQGKILFEFFVVKGADGFLLDVRRDKAADLVKRLSMYRLRAKVEIKDFSDQFAVAAVWWLPIGAQATSFTYEAELIESFADPRDHRLGLRLIVRLTAGMAPVRELRGVSISDEPHYRAARIEAGVAEGDYDYPLGDTYPHEANFDLTGGVSFAKGCYVGQEVVSRMQNKTVVRKRVAQIDGGGLESGLDVKIGDAVIGAVGTTFGGRALAMIRLDRVAEAHDKALPITVGGEEIVVDRAAVERYKQSVANKPVVDL